MTDVLPAEFPRLIQASRIVVLLGAGGVGKTTSSIAVALLGAKMGRRVALLSIDPARRLAAALGIPLGNQLRRIQLDPALGVTGTVDAAMLDQKAVFDSMVRRHAPSDRVAEKILVHPVYKAASTNLSGPLEYMALAKLQELAEDHRYDLIVLDTPPDTHALDFLARPNVLAGFMENRVMTWMVKPFLVASRFGLGRVLSASEKLMGGIAKVTGFAALASFGDFLVLMQEVIEGFHKSGEKIVELLHRPGTSFLLVTVPTLAAARGASNLDAQLKGLGYRTGTLIFNRRLPTQVAADLSAHTGTLPAALAALARRETGERHVIANLTSRIAVGRGAPLVLTLADQEQEIGDLAAVMALAERLAAQ